MDRRDRRSDARAGKRETTPMKKKMIIASSLALFASALVLLFFWYAKYSEIGKRPDFSGRYEYCPGQTFCNFINVQAATSGEMRVSGQAYWQGKNSGEVNTGEIAGILAMDSSKGVYKNAECSIDFAFADSQVTLQERNGSVCGGLNVSFDGTYTKK